MTHRDDLTRLRHMLEHSKEAVELVVARNRIDLDEDRLLNLALVRLMEIIGEAAGKVSREITEKNSQIPWLEIVGLRNRLIHGYDEVDFDILWEIVTGDLPVLLPELEKLVKRLE